MAEFPVDLAKLIGEWLLRNREERVSIPLITELVEAAFFASLQTEEGEAVRCTITFLAPERSVQSDEVEQLSNWRANRIEPSLELTTRNVVKLAKAIDPLFSTAAVYPSKQGKLEIWGITDQEISYHRFTSRDVLDEAGHAGLFHITIESPGVVSAFSGADPIGTLTHDSVQKLSYKVLHNGPISQKISNNALLLLEEKKFVEGLEIYLGDSNRAPKLLEKYRNGLVRTYAGAIARILLRIQRYRHGGALIIVGRIDKELLTVNYGYLYNRLRKAVEHYSGLRAISNEINREIQRRGITPSLFEARNLVEEQLSAVTKQMEGSISHIASLSRVDGAIVFDERLNVLGFGTIISAKNSDFRIQLARNTTGTKGITGKKSAYGTRHGSMMSYCSASLDDIGFVVSQDGAVRAFSSINGTLTMWENIALKYSRSYEN